MILLGDSILTSKQGKKIHKLVKLIAQQANVVRENWNGFNVLNKYASRVGGLTIGFVPYDKGMSSIEIKHSLKQKGKIKILFVIEGDDFELDNDELKNTFVIYLGHHGDKIASLADIILPTTAFTEKNALYINMEGRPQFTKQVIPKPGKAVDAWKVFKALDQNFNSSIKANNHQEILNSIFMDYPNLEKIGVLTKEKWHNEKSEKITLTSEKNNYLTKNFYQTCSISRSSENMANCVKEILVPSEKDNEHF